jgi:hypothetical protein
MRTSSIKLVLAEIIEIHHIITCDVGHIDDDNGNIMRQRLRNPIAALAHLINPEGKSTNK